MAVINIQHPLDKTEDDVSRNQYQELVQSHLVGQWITSLAISVVCCAVLFVLFASYMVGISERANMAEIRLDMMQEKYVQLVGDMKVLRQAPPTVLQLQGFVPTTDPMMKPVGAYKIVPVAPKATEKKKEK